MSHELRESYRTAEPFPHVVMRNFFPRITAELIVDTWPKGGPHWKRYRDGKFACNDLSAMGGLTSGVLEWLNWEGPRQRLTEITGIPNLLPDPEFTGAGLHEVRNGGRLGMHLDFNRLGTLYRRLNLLIYLNPEWKEEWGGCLELGKPPVKKILPTLGTAVLFDSCNGWHGHPIPLSPDAPPRRSLAVYYYTVDPPPGYEGDRETTIYAHD